MTNERDYRDDTHDKDEVVSAMYRQLAAERVPDRLNKSVLRQAAKPVRRPYAISVLWTKPIAWAATIAICLAITLQVTQLPDPELIPAAVMPPAMEQTADEGAAVSKTRQESPAKELRSRVSADGVVAESLASEPGAAPATPNDAPETSELKRSMPEFEFQDTDMLRRADEMVRMQSGSTQPSEEIAAPAVAASPALAFDTVAACDDAARAQPESWQACIEMLEEAGLAEEAQRQREQLADAFPEFEAP
jgi:hypothetical protein